MQSVVLDVYRLLFLSLFISHVYVLPLASLEYSCSFITWYQSSGALLSPRVATPRSSPSPSPLLLRPAGLPPSSSPLLSRSRRRTPFFPAAFVPVRACPWPLLWSEASPPCVAGRRRPGPLPPRPLPSRAVVVRLTAAARRRPPSSRPAVVRRGCCPSPDALRPLPVAGRPPAALRPPAGCSSGSRDSAVRVQVEAALPDLVSLSC